MENKFYHSVYLEPDLCKGCIHCIKRCPTEAIRVRNGKAHIIKEFCIDCSECILHCPHHAKQTRRDKLEDLPPNKYLIAIVDPSLYGQFNHITDINLILSALLGIGFSDVFEMAYAAEYLSEQARIYAAEHPEIRPIINTTCPSVERLIRVRFPGLIPNLLPLLPPVEIAAQAALHQALSTSGLPREDIGIVYISPCPAQVSFAKSPLGMQETHIDAVIAMKDIYHALLHQMNTSSDPVRPLSKCGKTGIKWGTTCSEARSMQTTDFLAADGIENVIRVLEDLEDGRIPDDLLFAELNGCSAGCVGGVLNVENPYIARAKIKQLDKFAPYTMTHRDFFENICHVDAKWTEDIVYEPVFRLGENMEDSMNKLNDVEELLKKLPGLDCGSCGCPTCRTLAEDVIRGSKGAKIENCIHLLRGYYHKLKENQPN